MLSFWGKAVSLMRYYRAKYCLKLITSFFSFSRHFLILLQTPSWEAPVVSGWCSSWKLELMWGQDGAVGVISGAECTQLDLHYQLTTQLYAAHESWAQRYRSIMHNEYYAFKLTEGFSVWRDILNSKKICVFDCKSYRGLQIHLQTFSMVMIKV